MSKFKVGDNVLYNNNKYKITKIEKLNDEVDMFKLDDRTFVVGHGELNHYVTPHQELLDLGFDLTMESDNSLTYKNFKEQRIIIIYKKRKEYHTDIRLFDLQLAKLLVRYIDELN